MIKFEGKDIRPQSDFPNLSRVRKFVGSINDAVFGHANKALMAGKFTDHRIHARVDKGRGLGHAAPLPLIAATSNARALWHNKFTEIERSAHIAPHYRPLDLLTLSMPTNKARRQQMRHQPELQALAPWIAAFGVTPDTRILTPLGERAACELAIGDLVNTRDDGPQPITTLREAFAAPSERNHFSVCIAQGALGFGLPHADLQVGSQHRVLFEHIRVPLLFGSDAVLVRAKSLAVSHRNIAVQKCSTPTSYVQISLETQAIIFAEGVPIESILPDGECDLEFMTLRSWELLAAVA
jgi:hypothetical protein